MALSKCNVDTNVIASLGTKPDERGLTTDQFKGKFDESPTALKNYINNTLTTEIDNITNIFTDTGTANAILITPTPAYATYQPNIEYYIKVANTNTGATTIKFNALAAKPLKKNFSSDLESGDIVAGQVIHIAYDGTNFQMLSCVSKVITNITKSTSAPSGGKDGDVWLQYV